MNWAENMLLGHPFARSKTQLAIINVIEPDTTAQTQDSLASTFLRSHTFDELYLEVAQAASGLKKLGVGHGDRVAAFTPNNAEAVILLLAASSLGSIYSTVSPEIGVPAVLERFVQVSWAERRSYDDWPLTYQLKPKVLLSADKYRSAGKAIDIIPKLREVAAELKKGDLAHVVIVGQLKKDRRPEDHLPKLQGVNVLAYPDFLDKKAIEIEFWRGQSNAPLWVLYSSGTSTYSRWLSVQDVSRWPQAVSAGKPKPIVHGQLAMVLGHKQGILLHAGLKPGDRHLQITTTGWDDVVRGCVMGTLWLICRNSTVGHLCCGITIMLYDGSPLVPNPTILFDLIDAYK